MIQPNSFAFQPGGELRLDSLPRLANGKIDRAALRETGIIATRQLAKRQLTWLRSMPERVVLDCLAPDPANAMLAQIAERLG